MLRRIPDTRTQRHLQEPIRIVGGVHFNPSVLWGLIWPVVSWLEVVLQRYALYLPGSR